VTRLLEIAGATVSIAGSASEAIERILAARPNVLVCDLGMPEEDGYSLAGSHESNPLRFSESSGQARGTGRAASCRKQPGRSQGHNSARRRLAMSAWVSVSSLPPHQFETVLEDIATPLPRGTKTGVAPE
jgi:hypothetical protein